MANQFDANTSGSDDLDASPISEDDRVSIVDTLVESMGELFHGYADGDVSFEELTFEMYDTLQTLHAVATGNISIEYVDEDDDDVELEDLALEPVREADTRRKGKNRGGH